MKIRFYIRFLPSVVLVGLLLAPSISNSSTNNGEITVLAVHSYHQGYGWTNGQHQGFEERLRALLPDTSIQLYSEYLDTKRRRYTGTYQQFLFDYLQDKYRQFQPDLIYATDDNALRFLQRYGQSLFGETPVVFSGVNDLKQRASTNHRVQGVFERLMVQQNIELIQRLFPLQETVIFVGDSSSTHQAMVESIRHQSTAAFPEIDLRFIAGQSLSDVVEQLRATPQGIVVLTTIGGFWDNAGQVLPLATSLRELASAGNHPIFVMEDTYLLPGVIGGWVNSSKRQGQAAADIAVKLLQNEAGSVAPGDAFPAEAVFDYPSVIHHRLSPAALPESARLINEPDSPLYQYRYEIGIVGSIFLGLLWAIILLILNTRRRLRAERALEASRKQLFRLFDEAPDGIFLSDFRGNIIDANKHAATSLGFNRDEIKTKSVFDFDTKVTEEGLSALQQRLNDETTVNFESQHQQADGRKTPVDIRTTLFEWQGDTALLSYVRDISERKQIELQLLENEERLNFLAFHDPLTGLPNRLLFQDRLEHALHLAERHHTGLAVLFLDLDRFKNINDSLGHDVGDRVLCRIAERLKKTVRETDTVARLGGDEFVILIEDVVETDFLAKLAQKIIEVVQPPMTIKEGELFVTTSLGLALYPQDASTPQELMRFADVAMYKAKESRNGYRFYHPDMDARATEFLFMESSLRRALELDQFVLHFQPQFDLEDGHLVGMEALLRWDHPEKGMVSPGDFIPLAEETGLIVPMGDWVLREACRQMRQWLDAGLSAVPLAINISPVQFRQANWSQTVGDALSEAGIDPYLLELEITENLLMEHTESAMATMDALNRMGVAVSIDDFGAGYSSLAYLKQFPLKKLKIDRSFITDFDTCFNDAAIVCAMINLGWSLGLQIVAEGIETEKQLQFLKEQGCHQGQGFLLGRPMTVDQIIDLMKKELQQAQ